MRILIAMFLMAAACLACLTAVTSVSSQTGSPSTRVETEPAKQRQLIKTLRRRIMKGNPSQQAFWRDIEQLEQLGPPEFKIAVKKYPSGLVVHTYKNVRGMAVADGDLELGPFAMVQAEQARLRSGQGNLTFAAATGNRSLWWPQGRVPFEIADDLPRFARRAIRDAIKDYQEFTPVTFIARDRERQYVRFVKQLDMFGLANMTNSTGANGGEVKISLLVTRDGRTQSRFEVAAAARHEIGHALGLIHEHNRSDRDTFVDVDEECADFFYVLFGNYAIEADSQNFGPYDYESVMQYPSIKGKKGWPWEKPKTCYNLVKQPSQRAAGDTEGVIENTDFLSVHDINALHHMYGLFGPSGSAGDNYGNTVLTHDFDPPTDYPRYPDLVVGAPNFRNGAGAVFLYKGTASGFVLWKVLEERKKGRGLGASLAVGDFNGDKRDELAVGAPNSSVGAISEAGKVFIYEISGNSSQFTTREFTKPIIDASIESRDHFGETLAAGKFIDPAETKDKLRTNLAIGAPGARTVQGRVGRVWVWQSELEGAAAFREVGLPRQERFAQIGKALAVLKDPPSGDLRPSDRLAIAAPGIIGGPCATPRVYVTKQPFDFNSVDELRQHAPPDRFCPRQPTEEPYGAFPTLPANLRSSLASGDFNGDDHADLVVNEPDNMYLYMSNENGQLELNRILLNTEFPETQPEDSFGMALTTGDLNHDGLDDLVVGAPFEPYRELDNVGRVYVYRGCVPGVQTVGPPEETPLVTRPNPNRTPRNESTVTTGTCPGLLFSYTADQTSFQDQDLLSPITGTPLYPAFTEPKADDQFGRGLAIAPPDTGGKPMLIVGSQRKAHESIKRTGAVFLFMRSVSGDFPLYRNQLALTSEFMTRIRRP